MKKLLFFLLFLAAGGLLWFLFLKKYDYEFRMDAKYGPGSVYREIFEWEEFIKQNSGEIKIKDTIPYRQLVQEFNSGTPEQLDLLWEFEKENDSVTGITVNVRVPNDRLKNRLAILNPFKKSELVDSLKNKLLDFKRQLNKKQEAYRIHISDSIVKSPAMDCICHSSKNISLNGKAWEMLQTIEFLQDYVMANDLDLSGSPFVKVTRWDREKDLMDFDFCFPVNLVQSLRETKDVQFKTYSSSSSLKAVFNGNYRSSYLAWFDLLEKAEERDLKYSALPLEIFHDNPQSGTDAITWKADIYLPVLPQGNP
ncbi:hypothetical protein C7S20_16330 [Christiangramia fulva]|uniref:GyrI-like small molecule binding domain-containing protein n=1 Tax=Christiangramia fulva TaxID=2126553 RepID=A0A2R3Z8V5_9FLAO|nr:hypothetical protein [Christiangramia fulva]AVR46707.1 hypothetical protein C7S20_16330 [Christiangramia fulva]